MSIDGIKFSNKCIIIYVYIYIYIYIEMACIYIFVINVFSGCKNQAKNQKQRSLAEKKTIYRS